MQMLAVNKAIRRRNILRLNILLAMLVFVVSFFLTVTGEYKTLDERLAAESLYNALILGSFLYMTVTWMFCTLTRPFWFPKSGKK